MTENIHQNHSKMVPDPVCLFLWGLDLEICNNIWFKCPWGVGWAFISKTTSLTSFLPSHCVCFHYSKVEVFLMIDLFLVIICNFLMRIFCWCCSKVLILLQNLVILWQQLLPMRVCLDLAQMIPIKYTILSIISNVNIHGKTFELTDINSISNGVLIIV